MQNAFGDDDALARVESDQAIFEIEQELAFDDIEKLVVVIVFVPVVFTAKNAQAHDGGVYLAERLVVPLKFAVIGELLFFDDFQRLVVNVEASFVRIRRCVVHDRTPQGFVGDDIAREKFIRIANANEFARL